jgi:hypothetical protein
VEEDVCEEGAVDIQTAEPVMGCEAGFTMDAKTGMCGNGDVKVRASQPISGQEGVGFNPQSWLDTCMLGFYL